LVIPDSIMNNPLYAGVLVNLKRSDHAPFWDRGYAAINVTDTADMRYVQYHCGDRSGTQDDVVENLDHDFAANVVRATVFAAAAALTL